jgi:hypothetical protein
MLRRGEIEAFSRQVAELHVRSPVVTEGRAAVPPAIYKGPENARSEQLRQVEQVDAQFGVPVAIRSMPM